MLGQIRGEVAVGGSCALVTRTGSLSEISVENPMWQLVDESGRPLGKTRPGSAKPWYREEDGVEGLLNR